MSGRKPTKPASDSTKSGARPKKLASDSTKPSKSSDVSTGATPDSSEPSYSNEQLDEDLKAPLPEECRQCKTYGELCKWVLKDENLNDFIEKLNYCGRGGDSIRREKHSPTIYAIVVNDDILGGRIWKFVKVGFTQIDARESTKNRMVDVKKQIKENGYKSPSVLFKLPIRAIDTTPFFDTEERIRNQFGFQVDKQLAKMLNLPVKTEWVLSSQENIDKYKEKEKGMMASKSTSIFKECPDLKFVKTLKDTSQIQTACEFEQWLKKKKNFPNWLGLREKGDTYEVFKQGNLPAELQNHLGIK